jgi:hypothetical protein
MNQTQNRVLTIPKLNEIYEGFLFFDFSPLHPQQNLLIENRISYMYG